MRVDINITQEEATQVILNYIQSKTGIEVSKEAIKFEVKSKQNFRSEWEEASFRVRVMELGA